MANSGLDMNTLISSGIGALIGSALTLVATIISHNLQKTATSEAESRHLLGLLQGIHDEMESLWEGYSDSAGVQLESLQENQALLMYWPITQDYFTIYNANAFSIGKVADHDLRKLIISTYSKARGLIDTFRMNNDLVQKYEYAYLLFQESQNPIHQSNMNLHLQVLVNYSVQLKKRHTELKQQVSELLRRLRKEGVLSHA